MLDGNVIANLELMPLNVIVWKNDKIGDRQASMAKAFHGAGLLSDGRLKIVMEATRRTKEAAIFSWQILHDSLINRPMHELLREVSSRAVFVLIMQHAAVTGQMQHATC